MPEEVVEETRILKVQVVRPPVPLLVLAGVSVVVSVALLLLPGLAAHIAGYVFASFVAIALVGVFRRTDVHRRQQPAYVPHPSLSRWAGAIAISGVVVAGVHTWWIATELAK